MTCPLGDELEKSRKRVGVPFQVLQDAPANLKRLVALTDVSPYAHAENSKSESIDPAHAFGRAGEWIQRSGLMLGQGSLPYNKKAGI
jgi:hypothetical protein